MRDDFGNDKEEFMELRPEPGKKTFSHHIWNHGVIPACKKLIKLRKVKRLRAGFDDTQGKSYHITVWTDKMYGWGGTFAVRPVSGGISWNGRDLHDNTFFEGESWDDLIETVQEHIRVDPRVLEHTK